MLSVAQTIPLVAPDAEIDGEAPGQPNAWPLGLAAMVLNSAVVVLKLKSCRPELAAPMYSELFQNPAVDQIPSLPTPNDCWTFELTGLNFPPYFPNQSCASTYRAPSFP